jgi:hypothetical protein
MYLIGVCDGTALQAGRSRVRFPMESLEFFSDLIRRGGGGAGVAWWLKRYANCRKVSGSIPGWGFFSEANDGTMCPEVDSASKNEYQESFLAGKSGRCVGLTT